MKQYIPHTASEIKQMLEVIGVSSLDALFADIPESLQLHRNLDVPPAETEAELLSYFGMLSDSMEINPSRNFLGAGAYPHLIPSIIPYLIQRGEFLTAYTPYQPEVSQGTLQAIFEFQTLICQLTGMATANASMYDGSTALAEAAIMSHRLVKGRKILVSPSLHPYYYQVLKTYLSHQDVELVPMATKDGITDLNGIAHQVDDETIAVIVQNPNFFGLIEPLASIREAMKPSKALFICAVTEAMSLGLLKPPGQCGADIVVGEAQSFGMPVSFGGPYAGFFAIRDDRNYLRSMPGRLCGMTQDTKGRRGYVLTLSTREQHIRREKATSNICSNQALCALTATIYLSALGKTGLREVAVRNLQNAHYACDELTGIEGVTRVYTGSFFNEFTIRTPFPAATVLSKMESKDIYGGLDLAAFFPDRPNDILVCVTEFHKDSDIGALCRGYKDVLTELNRAGSRRQS